MNAPTRTESTATTWTYVPSFDALRAFALVAVVAFHYWPRWAPGGFVGVDLFFVLSGYLITGMAQVEFESTTTLNLRAFWGRRIRRLVPAVLLLVAVCAVAVTLTDTGSVRSLLDSIGALTWTTNWIEAYAAPIWRELGNSNTVLDHLWSLAIEEQFYLVWPLALLVILPRLPDARRRVIAVGLVSLVSVVLMAVVSHEAAYFRTDTRAFELLAGAMLALSGWRPPKTWSPALLAVGVAVFAIMIAIAEPGSALMYPWGFLLVVVGSLALITGSFNPPGWARTVLENRNLGYVGKLSYGLYLWHIPVLRLLSMKRTGLQPVPLTLLRLVVLTGIAVASYELLEQPIRTRRLRVTPRIGIVAVAVTLLACVPLVPVAREDFASRWDVKKGPPKIAANRVRTAVVGDLLGAAAAKPMGLDSTLGVWDMTDPGCPFTTGLSLRDGRAPLKVEQPCGHWVERWQRGFTRFGPEAVVIASGLWDSLEIREPGAASTSPALGGEALRTVYRDLIHRQVMTAMAPGRSVSIVSVEDWSKLVERGQRDLTERAAAIREYNEALHEVAAEFPLLNVISMPGAPSWDDVRTAALTQWAPSVLAAPTSQR